MPHTRSQASKLLTKAEMEIFNASHSAGDREVPAKRLEAQVKRARTLRTKYRDLAKRQTRKARRTPTRGAGGTRAPAERTKKKAQIFDEVLARFRKHLEKRKARDAREKKKVPAKSSRELVKKKRKAQARQVADRQSGAAAKSRKATSTRGAGRSKTDGQVAGYPQRFGASRTDAIHGHLSSQDRRNQARRDGRA